MTHSTIDGGGRPTSTPWRLPVWTVLGAMLLAPAVLMRFTREVSWTAFDFAVFGALLAVVGGLFELAMRIRRGAAFRAAAGLAIATGFLLVWANLAVGFIGAEDNPWNLMFAGVLAIPLLGALIARGRPRGMAVTLAVTAAAQGLASVIGAAAGQTPPWPMTGVFVGLWLVSAGLFHWSGRVASWA